MKKKILNLSCGKDHIIGSIGVERVNTDDFVDVIYNFDITSYFFEKSIIIF